PNLGKLLLQKIDEADTFVDVDLREYVSIVAPIAVGRVGTEPVEKEAVTDALRNYSQLIVSRVQSLYVPSSAVSDRRLDLDSWFIAPSFRPARDWETSLSLGTMESGNTLSLEHILGRSVRVVILGNAGTGKTTVLHYMASAFASGDTQRLQK